MNKVKTIKSILLEDDLTEEEVNVLLYKGLVTMNKKIVYADTPVGTNDIVNVCKLKGLSLYVPVNDSSLGFVALMNLNWEQIVACDALAAKNGTLVGRYIKEPYADGYAVYQIIKENKRTVRLCVCTGIGDDWVLPYFGEETTVNKEYIESSIQKRDLWKSLFRKNA